MRNLFKMDNKGEITKVNILTKYIKLSLLVFMLGSLTGMLISPTRIEARYYSPEKDIFVTTPRDSINLDIVYAQLLEWNIKYPEVVLAQCMIESAYLASPIYVENNNLFGMKVAVTRSTTALGVNRGHAYYRNWREPIMDYALFQAAFTRKIKKESDYIDYINRVYAEDLEYGNKIRKLLIKIKKKYDST